MTESDKLAAEASLLLSRIMFRYFQRYRSSINFLEPYRLGQRKKTSGANRRTALAALYILLIIACVSVLVVYYMRTDKLQRETALIMPRIDVTEEERLKAELESARSALASAEALSLLYSTDEEQYRADYRLKEEYLSTLTQTAAPNVTILALVYSSENNVVSLECVTDSPTSPKLFVERLERAFPTADIEYYGYTAGENTVKFGVLCHFAKDEVEDE